VRAKPDGYTLLIASVGLAANPSLYKKLGFAPQVTSSRSR
jgi:Tripartite tricarboxylate transporter family receptor